MLSQHKSATGEAHFQGSIPRRQRKVKEEGIASPHSLANNKIALRGGKGAVRGFPQTRPPFPP
jgi:hypothetical protein